MIPDVLSPHYRVYNNSTPPPARRRAYRVYNNSKLPGPAEQIKEMASRVYGRYCGSKFSVYAQNPSSNDYLNNLLKTYCF